MYPQLTRNTTLRALIHVYFATDGARNGLGAQLGRETRRSWRES